MDISFEGVKELHEIDDSSGAGCPNIPEFEPG